MRIHSPSMWEGKDREDPSLWAELGNQDTSLEKCETGDVMWGTRVVKDTETGSRLL